ncbi:MAG: DNA methyltransferase [Halobaculum sp.]
MGDSHRQTRLVTDDEGGFDERRARETALPVEEGEVIDTAELADHQEYVPDRGVYDERNAVNDLTGREWKVATKSVIHEAYPPALCHELRSEHGGQKPPRLCLELIERFSAAGDRVLDPFAGVGGTLLGASLAEHEGTGRREAVGIERVARWVEIYETVLDRANEERADRGDPPLAPQSMRHADCRTAVEELATDSVDLLLTDVPYWDMDERDQTRNDDRTRASSLDAFDRDTTDRDGSDATDTDATGQPDDSTDAAATGQPDDPTDAAGDDESARATEETAVGEQLGDGTKAGWLAALGETFDAFRRVVRPGGYVVVFVGDMYRESRYEPLSAELAFRLREVGYTMTANLIWYDPSKELHVYGYPHSFVPSMVHQNVLVFQNT